MIVTKLKASHLVVDITCAKKLCTRWNHLHTKNGWWRLIEENAPLFIGNANMSEDDERIAEKEHVEMHKHKFAMAKEIETHMKKIESKFRLIYYSVKQ